VTVADPNIDELEIAEQELLHRIGWFIKLRWAAVLVASLILLIAWYVVGVHFAARPVLTVLLAVLFYNALFALFAKMVQRQRSVSARPIRAFVNVQIALDLVALACLIHYGGGVTNVFIMFFVFHMIIASELLSPGNAYLHATLAAALINGVCWLEYAGVLEHHPLMGLFPESATGGLGLHQDAPFVVAVTVGITSTLYLSVFLASSIANLLRARERDLERAYGQLKAADSEKSYFMRRAGHGLRSPLSAIQSLLRLVVDGLDGKVDDRARELVSRAMHRSDELIHLVNDLLRYSRLQASSELFTAESVSLDTVVTDTVDSLRPLADEKDVSLVVDIEPVTALGQPEDLGDVVSNLLSNAIKYTPGGRSVRLALRSESPWALLEVADEGIGIPADAVDHVFEEFYRAPNAKSIESGGTGLGLAIVKRIVSAHGGDIQVAGTGDNGTTFTVTLPLSQGSEEHRRAWLFPEVP
jgi:signal transduction histidine kinase